MAKEKKMKVPKRIAGVKVPKKLRKPVNKALAIAENPATRDLAVAALTAAAAALVRKGAEVQPRPRRPGEAGTDTDGAGTLTDAIIAAALDGARRLLDNREAPAPTEAEVIEAPAAIASAPRPAPAAIAAAPRPAPAVKRRRAPASGRAAKPRQDA